MDKNYTPREIAEVVGLTPETVRSYLRERFPSHERRSWWRMAATEYELAIGELRAAQAIMPHQPRRILHRPQMLLAIF